MCDIVLSLALLPALFAAALIALIFNPFLNPGPLTFCQQRVGRHGRVFLMYKLRTMVPGKESTQFADKERHRIRPFGKILRRYRLDELPQIFNVLKGEMSLIGPRPEQPAFAEKFRRDLPGYHLRHIVRPGLSGLAQVRVGYTCDIGGTKRKLDQDLQYIRQSGFRMETYVIWRTLVTVATGQGAI